MISTDEFQDVNSSIADRSKEMDQAQLNNKVSQAEAELISALKELSKIYELQESYSELIPCYKQLIAISPKESKTYLKLARLYRKRGEIHKAIATFQDLIEINPDSPAGVYKELGDLLFKKQNNTQEALQAYQMAVTLKDNWNSEFYIKLAKILIQEFQYEQAIEQVKKAISITPNVPYHYMVMGNALYSMNLKDEAIQCFTRVIQIKPDSANAYRRIGDVLVSKNDLATASRCYQKALKLNPQAVGIYRSLGNIFAKQGQHSEAQKYYEKAHS